MKITLASLAIALIFIFGAFAISGKRAPQENIEPGQNVTVVDGVQIVEIDARGGYFPRKSVAKAGLPTVIRFKTSGTFDCSASVRIASLNISQILPQSGSTDIDIGNRELGVLKGSCGMGMYPFEVDFQS